MKCNTLDGDDRQRRLAGGVHFVRLETPNYHETRKVVLTQ
jgi:hypothetical protein